MQLERLTPEQRLSLSLRLINKDCGDRSWDMIFRVRAMKQRIFNVFYEGMKNGNA